MRADYKHMTDPRAGIAMTETALLCFFIYVPVLMMVIVWGDLTLDKESAGPAASYMAFALEGIRHQELVERYFPGARGEEEGTFGRREVGVSRDLASRAPDYTAAGALGDDALMDIQTKLFSMAIGEMWSSLEWVQGPDGVWMLEPVVRVTRDQVARYLMENEIVETFTVPDVITGAAGGPIQIVTGTDARSSPTDYALSVTHMLNGDWSHSSSGPRPHTFPRFISEVELWTSYRSAYLGEMGHCRFGEKEYHFDLPQMAGEPGVLMRFGHFEEEPQDDSFKTGYTFLLNPDGLPDGGAIRYNLARLSSRLFTHGEGADRAGIDGMVTPVGTEGDSPESQYPQRFLQPGDPRDDEE